MTANLMFTRHIMEITELVIIRMSQHIIGAVKSTLMCAERWRVKEALRSIVHSRLWKVLAACLPRAHLVTSAIIGGTFPRGGYNIRILRVTISQLSVCMYMTLNG